MLYNLLQSFLKLVVYLRIVKKPVIIGIVVAIVAGILYLLLVAPQPATAAVLYVESGSVSVNGGAGSNEMELKIGDAVKTGDGEATIVFYDGEVMHLQPNSEVEIEKLSSNEVKVKQVAGETWNKITRISGIGAYVIETPNTVATVRGTEFFLSDNEVVVSDGEVLYEHKKEAKKTRVAKGKRALARLMREEEASEEELARFRLFPEKYEKVLKHVREKEIKRHRAILRLAGKEEFSEERLRERLNEIDEGREDEDKAYEEIPDVMKQKARRAYLLTKEIKRAREMRRERELVREDREIEREREHREDVEEIKEREVMRR